MAVTFAAEPANSRTALIAGLNALGGAGTPSAAAHFRAIAGAEVPPPLPVYEFALDDLLAGRDPHSDSPVAWKFLLVCGSQPVRTADLIAGDSGLDFASISAAEAPAINNAIAVAENDPTITRGDYELRLVQVPALYVTALWLKESQNGVDRYVIVPPAPEGFTALANLTDQEFTKALLDAARRKDQATPRPAGTSPTN